MGEEPSPQILHLHESCVKHIGNEHHKVINNTSVKPHPNSEHYTTKCNTHLLKACSKNKPIVRKDNKAAPMDVIKLNSIHKLKVCLSECEHLFPPLGKTTYNAHPEGPQKIGDSQGQILHPRRGVPNVCNGRTYPRGKGNMTVQSD